MMRFSFGKRLTQLKDEETYRPGETAVSIMTLEEFKNDRCAYPHRKTLIHNMETIHYCKVESMGSSIMGTFVVPDKDLLLGRKHSFGVYVNGQELVLLDNGSFMPEIMDLMKTLNFGENTTAGSFFLFLLDYMIRDDVMFLQQYEKKLADVEEELLDHLPKNFYETVILCRKELLALHTYYEQLIAVGEELESNASHLFSLEECDGLAIFANRSSRLHDHVEMLREYVLQIREMYQSQIDIRQNQIMSWLTVVTSLFLPLSILVGWYGMNFVYMPELQWKYGYIFMIGISAVIIGVEVWFFKKKKML